MCVKIVSEVEQEFDPRQPLETQIINATEIVVNYDPYDTKISSFVAQLELMYRNGTSLTADIKVNANNNLDGMRLERHIDKLKMAFDTNEFIKQIALSYSVTDKKLREISNLFMGKVNEQ